MLVTARWLEPDPRGYGTHQQLGLPECLFRQLTGIGCPHCGLTTSLCLLVRGQVTEALRTNPSGIVVLVSAISGIPVLMLNGLIGRNVSVVIGRWQLMQMVIGFLVFTVMIWIVRSG